MYYINAKYITDLDNYQDKNIYYFINSLLIFRSTMHYSGDPDSWLFFLNDDIDKACKKSYLYILFCICSSSISNLLIEHRHLQRRYVAEAIRLQTSLQHAAASGNQHDERNEYAKMDSFYAPICFHPPFGPKI
jgi:hypothetical protein